MEAKGLRVLVSAPDAPKWRAYRAALLAYVRISADKSRSHEEMNAAKQALETARAQCEATLKPEERA